jgi:N6-L-threonylcarbamoyladenine synthase
MPFMIKQIKILGIETSCDETAASIVTNDKQILSHIIFNQDIYHKIYGGVVPEIASRAHLDKIDRVIISAMNDAKLKFSELDAIAVTAGPGLIGGVIVGLMSAKAIASAAKLPLIGVNHLEAHALAARIVSEVSFPFLLLLVSGGHCQILIVENVGKYQLLGATMDDAVGEAFDKVAKMLKLEYPGGPKLEILANAGNEKKYNFPKACKGNDLCNFSFSGLKTALKRTIEKSTTEDYADIAASFQYTVKEILQDRMINAIKIFKSKYPLASDVVIAGGVAANQYLKKHLQKTIKDQNMNLTSPPIELCTDNGAMVAWAGLERFRMGYFDNLSIEPRARWPLA